MALSVHMTLSEVLSSEKGQSVLEKHAPGISNHQQLAMLLGMSLASLAASQRGGLSEANLEAIAKDFGKPIEDLFPEGLERRSLRP